MTALSSTATLGEVRKPAEGGPSYIYRGGGVWDLHVQVSTSTVDLTGYYTKGQIDTALGTRDANITSVASAAAAAATTANAAIPATQKAAANGVASLDASGRVPAGQLGNVPTAPVSSVAGRTGAVTLAKADVGLGNVDNTSDANKPISMATAGALAGKQASLGYTPVNKAGDTITGSLDLLGVLAGGLGALSQNPDNNYNSPINCKSGSGPYLLTGTDPNGPGVNYWFHTLNFEFGSRNGTGEVTQFAIPYAYNAHLSPVYMRGRSSGTWGSWVRLFTSSDYSAGSPVRTVNGSGPDGSGNVTVTSGVTDVRFGAAVTLPYAHPYTPAAGHVVRQVPYYHQDYGINGTQVPLQKQVSGTWITVSQV